MGTAFWKDKHSNGNLSGDLRLLILILANNEEYIIARTLKSILRQSEGYQYVDVAVLADNCTDDTIGISSSFGVKVYKRSDGDPGKGKALSWFINIASGDLEGYDFVTIMDADTIIPTDFLEQMQIAFSFEGIQVVQAYIEPENIKDFPITILAGYSEILAQRIDDAARSRLGWSVPLKGKGMVFRTGIFRMVCKGLQTQVDDIELSLRLAEHKILVNYFPALRVIDPNTDVIIGLAKQRGRWLKGQRDIWKSMKGNAGKWLLSGPSTLSLLHALLLKPKTAVFLVKIILFIVFALWHPILGGSVLFSFVILISILIDMLYYLIGLRFVDDVKMYLLALLSAPLYFILWLIGYVYSFIPGQKWLRGRD